MKINCPTKGVIDSKKCSKCMYLGYSGSKKRCYKIQSKLVNMQHNKKYDVNNWSFE